MTNLSNRGVTVIQILSKISLVGLVFASFLARAETCESATQQLSLIEKTWSNKNQDSDAAQTAAVDVVDRSHILYGEFAKISSGDSCRPTLFRSIVRSAAALAPFDFENAGATSLEETLYAYKDLQPIFESTLKDYMNQYSNKPRVSCRAQMLLQDVKAHRCDREHKKNCFNQGPRLTDCMNKDSQ